MIPTKPNQDISPPGNEVKSKIQRVMSPDVEASYLEELVSGNTEFAFDLYQSVRDQENNLFFSPFSISLALAMAYAGAEGKTREQMASVLHYRLPPEDLHPTFNGLDLMLIKRGDQVDPELGTGFQLNIANSTWAQRDHHFLQEYLDLLAENYGAGVRLTDFVNASDEARRAINEWVSDETQGKIEDLIPPGAIDTLTRLVLANAIYFKASWLNTFQQELTEDRAFNLLDGSQVIAPMMNYSKPERLRYSRGDGYQAVELPYVGEDISMVILVPDVGKFSEFEESMNAAQFNAILDLLEAKNVQLALPKFSFESQFSLADTLRVMGLTAAFDPREADLSGMDGSQDLFITNVLHKAFVSVDEKGTEAAAATAIIVGVTSLPVVDVELTIDRPFIFLIRDIPTGTILFTGRVLSPSQ
jgi:serpin B